MEKKFTKIKKDESDLNDLNWFEVKNSKFTVWHRPKTSQIPLLKEKFGLTCLITLQSERENLKEIELMCKKIRIDWLHIPLEGANLPLLRRKETKTIIINGLIKSIELLNALENQTLFIHCAAGVHRTGIFTYSLLRLMGFSIETSKSHLLNLRPVTFKGVGQERLKYAEDEILQKFFTDLKK